MTLIWTRAPHSPFFSGFAGLSHPKKPSLIFLQPYYADILFARQETRTSAKKIEIVNTPFYNNSQSFEYDIQLLNSRLHKQIHALTIVQGEVVAVSPPLLGFCCFDLIIGYGTILQVRYIKKILPWPQGVLVIFFFYLFGLGFFVLILELLKIWIYSKSLKGQDKMCLHDE